MITCTTLKLIGDDADQQLMEAAQSRTCTEREKYVTLVMDEMHIKEDVVYDKHMSSDLQSITNFFDCTNL